MHFFGIDNIAFKVLNYPISYVELIGTLSGFVSVYLASRANILTWATGLVNEIFLFMLFFQIQLYADMFLQIYFFVVTIYGWLIWNSNKVENKICELNFRNRITIAIAIIICSILIGFAIKNIHFYLPQYFKIQAAYPFADSIVMVISIVATILLAKKKIENWYLWLAVDIICVVLYFKKGIYFLSLEYFIFLGLASYGLFHWKKAVKG